MTQPDQFSAGGAFAKAISVFGENTRYCLLFACFIEGVSLVAAVTLALNTVRLSQLLMQLDMAPPDTFVYALVLWFLIVRLGLGVISDKFYLLLIQGKKVSVDDILGFDVQYHIPIVARYFAANIAYSFYCLLATLLIVFPGIIVSSCLRLYRFALVDQECNAVDSLKQSYEISSQHKTALVTLNLGILLGKAFGLLLLGVGFIPAMALCSLAEAAAYRWLSPTEEANILIKKS